MLTSHQRSHNTVPRSSSGPQMPRMNSITKVPISTYSNLRNQGGAIRRTIGTANAANLGNNIIRCGHCSGLFTDAKELNMHNCKKLRASTSSAMNNGTPSNKLYDLAAKASTAPKAGSSKQQAMHQQPARSRKPSPKKNLSRQDAEIAIDNSINESAHGDEDTQLIMILNQVTGELMEITAPKGMEVKDVIESLNFQQMEEAAASQQIDEQGMLMQEENVPQDEQEEAVANIEMLAEHQQEGTAEDQQQQMAVVVEAGDVSAEQHLLPSNDGAHEEQVSVSAEHHQQEPNAVTVDGSVMMVEHEGAVQQVTEGAVVESNESGASEVVENGGQIGQIIEGAGQEEGGSQIILPAECYNSDGTLTLTDDLFSQLSAQGHQFIDGNTTFIIEDSNVAEQGQQQEQQPQ